MSRLRVLHVIERLQRGGPLQALIAEKKRSRRPSVITHHIVSLKTADRRACDQAAAAGIAGTSAPDSMQLQNLIAEADIVQVHFWNSPDIHAFLASGMPPVRLLLWCHVNGLAPPHIIPKTLLDRSDLVVATAASTLNLPVFRSADPARVCLVQGAADFTRISRIAPVAHEGFYVGYIGTIDFTKLHSAYIPMCAAVNIPAVHFLLCGKGGATQELKRQARELGILERLEFHDYVDDIKPVLARLDVFGYPLRENSFATAELSLQEAMYAGIPPVVFANDGPNQLVTDRKTGRVVRSETEYVAAIEWLYRNPAKRQLLGRNAARAIRRLTRGSDGQSDAVYARVMEYSKRSRVHAIPGPGYTYRTKGIDTQGAWSFIHSLDGIGDNDFITSLTAADSTQAEEAELRIARSNANLNVVLQYRLRHLNDPHLHLWVGLMLFQRGRPALAATEFNASIALGYDSQRVHRYFENSIKMAKQSHGTLRTQVSDPVIVVS